MLENPKENPNLYQWDHVRKSDYLFCSKLFLAATTRHPVEISDARTRDQFISRFKIRFPVNLVTFRAKPRCTYEDAEKRA